MNRNIEKDLSNLGTAFFDNLEIDNCEFGGIGLNSKRPFGNSDVENDILEIIGCEKEFIDDEYTYSDDNIEYARELYFKKLIPYLTKKWNEFSEKDHK